MLPSLYAVKVTLPCLPLRKTRRASIVELSSLRSSALETYRIHGTGSFLTAPSHDANILSCTTEVLPPHLLSFSLYLNETLSLHSACSTVDCKSYCKFDRAPTNDGPPEDQTSNCKPAFLPLPISNNRSCASSISLRSCIPCLADGREKSRRGTETTCVGIADTLSKPLPAKDYAELQAVWRVSCSLLFVSRFCSAFRER